MSEARQKPLDPVTLTRIRHDLAAASGKRRLDLILDAENPMAVVRALPADELYFTIGEIGLADAADLVQLASPAQFRVFLDLAAWTGDRVDPRKALPWLSAARGGALRTDPDDRRWRAKLSGLDLELLNLVLRDALRIHDLEEDDDPHLESEHFMRTAENKFVIEFLVEGAEYAAVRGIVDDLTAEDPFKTTRLLSSLRWELPSELEETELRWRTARLADLGYPSLEEALSWFAKPVRASAPPAGVPARPPGFWLARAGAGTGSLLARAAARLTIEEREHLELELVTAANAVVVADAVDAGDPAEVRRAVEAARALVEMGLQEAAAGDDARAAEVLATTAVKALFQRGFGKVLALKWSAERLLASGRAGTREVPLLDAPLGEVLAALARRRPGYFPGVEAPRAEWGTLAAGAFEPRSFRGPEDVLRTAEALRLAEALAALAADLGLSVRAEGPLAPRLATLYLTALANERLGRAFRPDPIPAGEVEAAAKALERLDDARLAARGEAGALLAELAAHTAEELALVRDAGAARPQYLRALLVAN
ncbi:MAG: DUF6178 family protein [Anaeromyxobacteraceae bacterium]